MQKAKLNISKTKKGGYAVSLTFEDNKTLPLSDYKPSDDKLNGKEVEVIREGGQVKKIICEEQVIYDKTSQGGGMSPKNQRRHSGNQPREGNTQSSTSLPATAPYNFVPLNDKVVPAEEIPDFDTYHNDRYTGYIDLEIETKTPLYIRDILNEDEIKERDSIEEERKQNKSIPPYCNPNFFSPGNALRIPGSSLRGMTRTMVEIVSFGKFGCFDDRRLYYRAVGDTSKLGEDYRNTMVNINDNHFPKIKAGLLKNGIIYPSKVINGTQIYRINFHKSTGVIDNNFPSQPDFSFREVFFSPTAPTLHTHYRLDRNHNKTPYQLKYAKISSIAESKDNHHTHKGYLITSGKFGSKKHMHWVINEPETTGIVINKDLLASYKADTNRDERADLLKKLEDHPEGVPCFYIVDDNDNIISFGHTGMFRLAYTKTIGDHIPASLKDPNTIDIPETIFGNEKTFAGRVFFEDALCLSPKEEALMDEAVPKILSGPKPTTFQHYLEQNAENLQNHPKNLAHYNSNTNIRGYKLYWHKDGSDWAQTDSTAIANHSSQYTRINPVKPDVKFTGRIRFENLSNVELGALLFALDLPDGCYHKLGMAKPLGLGSVKITPKLYISDRAKRYRSLSAEWNEPIEASSIAVQKKGFEDYVKKQLQIREDSLWKIDRLKELKAMLDFQNKPSKEKTRYMEIERATVGNEYKKRPVLPRPTKVKTS